MYAKYTVVLKEIMENAHSRPFLEKALSTYPLYTHDPSYGLIPTRSELNQKLLNHYKYREIGFETVGRFLDELEITMNEIMPYYNEMFDTVVIMHELPSPFDNVDVTETFEQVTEGETTNDTSSSGEGSTSSQGSGSTSGTNSSSNEAYSKNVHSATPQNNVDIPAKNINDVMYADDVTWDHNSSEENGTVASESNSSENVTSQNESISTSAGTSKHTTSHTYKKIGNQGVNTYAHDMNEFRTSIIDVVYQIINDPRLTELFMSVF